MVMSPQLKYDQFPMVRNESPQAVKGLLTTASLHTTAMRYKPRISKYLKNVLHLGIKPQAL